MKLFIVVWGKMVSTREQLIHLMKQEKALSIDEIAKKLDKTSDFVKGMLESNRDYIVTNVGNVAVASISGLGDERCFFCADEGIKQDRYNQSTMSVYISDIPKEVLENKNLFDSFIPRNVHINGIRAHRKCYNSIDLFFRQKEDEGMLKRIEDNNKLTCLYCQSFSGEWIDNSEVEEKCNHPFIKEETTGHQGCLADRYACNLFSPDSEMRKNPDFEKERVLWQQIKPQIEQRTMQGYKNLVALLEKRYWIIPKN